MVCLFRLFVALVWFVCVLSWLFWVCVCFGDLVLFGFLGRLFGVVWHLLVVWLVWVGCLLRVGVCGCVLCMLLLGLCMHLPDYYVVVC